MFRLYSFYLQKLLKNMKRNNNRQRVFGGFMKGLMWQFFSLISAASFATPFFAGQGVLQRKISINVENAEVKIVLKKIEETGCLGVIKPSHANSDMSGVISGRITDAKTGEPLPGVNVAVKGTSQGTSA